ncbi:MAG: hypothetical protein FE78DRAFT_90721, partial [Acidomyces sp. 'richmondensis']
MELPNLRPSQFDGQEGRSSPSNPSEGLLEVDQPPGQPSLSPFGRLRRYARLEARQWWQQIDHPNDDDSEHHVPILGTAWSPSRGYLPREIRRLRRRKVVSFVKRGVCAVPLLFLMFLGALHVLETLIGRTRLFWNGEIYIRASSRCEHRPLAKARHDSDITRGVVPIPCQSHNDYWRDKPLFDAIHWGCIGAEADVWLFDEDLYVGHTLATLSQDRTLKNMYIDPLASLLGKHDSEQDHAVCAGHGLFETSPAQTFVLLIDIKNSGQETVDLVQSQLQSLRAMGCLSHWDGTAFNSREITVVLTGRVVLDHVLNNGTYRDIFFDAPLHALWEKPRLPISKSDSLHEKDGEIDYGTAMS